MSSILEAKDPDVPKEYGIDPRVERGIVPMRRDWPYQIGDIAKAPTKHTGFYYECTGSDAVGEIAGETSGRNPKLPATAGETANDGSIVWTARHPNDSNLPSINSVQWLIERPDDEPVDLIVDSERIVFGVVYPTFSGGEDGIDYKVTARVTWSNGIVNDATFFIPVVQPVQAT